MNNSCNFKVTTFHLKAFGNSVFYYIFFFNLSVFLLQDLMSYEVNQSYFMKETEHN